jgi:hypothetical protein
VYLESSREGDHIECDELLLSPLDPRSDAESATGSLIFVGNPMTLLRRSCAVVPTGLGATWVGTMRATVFEGGERITGEDSEGKTFDPKLRAGEADAL